MNDHCSRRRLLGGAGSVLALALTPRALLASARDARRLSFHHTHTGEALDIVYAEGGTYRPQALQEINFLLRDFRSGETHDIDPRLLDVLHLLRELTEGRCFEVISGFRSPATNDMLLQRTGGVARNSLHLTGRAVDVRLTGVATRSLCRAAVALGRGGVGYYPDSDFVHLDTGRFRTW
ncbi:MAG: DUF882 domain-containing protein [Gammaproteobacteria bacterium]|nr:DUF882 domain-containing protein [Gammaproteobacteria bacterium]